MLREVTLQQDKAGHANRMIRHFVPLLYQVKPFTKYLSHVLTDLQTCFLYLTIILILFKYSSHTFITTILLINVFDRLLHIIQNITSILFILSTLPHRVHKTPHLLHHILFFNIVQFFHYPILISSIHPPSMTYAFLFITSQTHLLLINL